MNLTDYMNIYETGEYLKKNSDWHLADSAWKARHALKMMNRNGLKPNLVYDVGCGAGGLLQCLYENMPGNVVFTGYDIAGQALDLAREREKDRVKFYKKNFTTENLPYADLIVCFDVFEHVEDYLFFLRSIRNKAKYKLFHIPLDISIRSVMCMSPIMNSRTKTGHLHYFSKETALASLVDTGYQIRDYFYTPSAFDLRYQIWWQQCLIMPIRLLFKLCPDLIVRVFGGYSLMVLAE